jgi:hypothetical protein
MLKILTILFPAARVECEGEGGLREIGKCGMDNSQAKRKLGRSDFLIQRSRNFSFKMLSKSKQPGADRIPG